MRSFPPQQLPHMHLLLVYVLTSLAAASSSASTRGGSLPPPKVVVFQLGDDYGTVFVRSLCPAHASFTRRQGGGGGGGLRQPLTRMLACTRRVQQRRLCARTCRRWQPGGPDASHGRARQQRHKTGKARVLLLRALPPALLSLPSPVLRPACDRARGPGPLNHHPVRCGVHAGWSQALRLQVLQPNPLRVHVRQVDAMPAPCHVPCSRVPAPPRRA